MQRYLFYVKVDAAVRRGVICLLRVVDGMVKKGDKVIASSSGEIYDVLEVRNKSHRWCMVPCLITYQNQTSAFHMKH